jgi:hypothetical protein
MSKLFGAGILTSAAIALLWVTVGAAPVQADEEADESGLSVGHTLVCDTPQEVEAVLSATTSDMTARLIAINNRYGKESCNVLTVLFYQGDAAKTILAPEGLVHIVKVDIVGYRSGDSWLRLSKPMEQYAGVLEKGSDV